MGWPEPGNCNDNLSCVDAIGCNERGQEIFHFLDLVIRVFKLIQSVDGGHGIILRVGAKHNFVDILPHIHDRGFMSRLLSRMHLIHSHDVEPACCYSDGLGNSINDVSVGLDIGKGDGGSSPIARFLGFEGCKLDI